MLQSNNSCPTDNLFSWNYFPKVKSLAIFFSFFTGKDATLVTYEPEDTDPEINAKLKKIASDLTFGK